MKDKHTGGEWKIGEDAETKCKTVIRSGEQVWDVASTQGSTFKGDIVKTEANAERIVTCVNALNGISNKALDKGVVVDTIEALRNTLDRYVALIDAELGPFAEEDKDVIACRKVLSILEGYNG